MALELSKMVQDLAPSATMEIDGMVKDLTAERGDEVINLAAGAPDFDAPEAVKKAMIKCIENNKLGYTKPGGLDDVREIVAADFKHRHQLDYSADEVMITGGGKQPLFESLAAILNPGDEVIIPAPYWVSYPGIVEIAGGKPVIFDLNKYNWSDLKDFITPKTKAIILNFPSNPTGNIADFNNLMIIAETLKNTNIWVISDEVYCTIIFDSKKHWSIASPAFEGMRERTIITDSGSKRYAIPGVRIGLAAGPVQIIKAMIKIQGQINGNPTVIGQYGLKAGIEECEQDVEEMRNKYERRRDVIIVPWANKMREGQIGFEYSKIQGAFYFWFRLPAKFNNQCSRFCKNLLKRKYVGLVPGIAFGSEGWARLSYAADPNKVVQALIRIEEYINQAE